MKNILYLPGLASSEDWSDYATYFEHLSCYDFYHFFPFSYGIIIMMKKNILRVFIIMSVLAAFQITNTFILARNLSKPDVGLFKIIVMMGELACIIGLVGMNDSFVRFFSRTSPGNYNWKAYSILVLLLCSLLSMIIVIGISIFYAFNIWLSIALAIIVVLGLANRLFTALLRSQKHYELTTFLERMNSIPFFILLMLILALGNLTLKNYILFYIASLMVAIFLIIHVVLKKIPAGLEPVPRHLPKDGLLFFGIAITIIIMLNANLLFIAKMLSYKDVAIYAIILSVMKIFEISVRALYYIFVPYLNTDKPIEVFKIISFLITVAICISIFYILAGRTLIHFLFKGQYDEGFYLLPYFIGIGIFRTLYVLPSSIAGGRAKSETLKRFFYFNCIGAFISIILNYVFILKWQLTGAALATLCTWAIMTCLGFFVVKDYLFSRNKI